MGADARAGTALFLLCLVLFASFSAPQILDSRYALLVSERLVRSGRFHLDGVPGLTQAAPDDHPGAARALPANLRRVNGRHHYLYLPGTSLLSAPFVAAWNAFGVRVSDDAGRYLRGGERRIQLGLASLLMACLCLLFFASARLLLPRTPSLWVAIAGGLGSPVWSTASRGLWSHTWGIALTGLAVFLLLRSAIAGRRPPAAALATLFAWASLCRPLFAIPAVAVGLWLGFDERRFPTRYALAAAAWLAAFGVLSRGLYGALLPPYLGIGADLLALEHLARGTAVHLVSPSRGLLIYAPVVLVPIYTLVRYRAWIRRRSLVILAASVVVAHGLVISASSLPGAGHCYGPRYSTDLVPWFALLGILGLDALARARADRGREVVPRGARGLAWTLLAVSVFMNGQAGVSAAPMKWNNHPTGGDRPIEERLWDWRHPQFLHGIQSEDYGFRAELERTLGRRD